jgi:hypothetical protein
MHFWINPRMRPWKTSTMADNASTVYRASHLVNSITDLTVSGGTSIGMLCLINKRFRACALPHIIECVQTKVYIPKAKLVAQGPHVKHIGHQHDPSSRHTSLSLNLDLVVPMMSAF